MPEASRSHAKPQLALARQGVQAMRLAATETLKTIAASQGWIGTTLEEGSVHQGDPPRQVDYDAHEIFERTLFSHPSAATLGVVDVFGEEKPQPLEPKMLEPGARVVIVDPLDGSTQWAMVRAGYCVASVMLVADEAGKTFLESAVLATPVHTFTYINGDLPTMDLTFSRSREPVAISSCLPVSQLQEPSVALTGYKVKDRESVSALMRRLPEWAFLTIGGNPVTPYVFAGDLSAAITLRGQSTWDAVGILMALETDAAVGQIDGTLWNDQDTDIDAFRKLFDSILFEGRTTPVPPMVVAKNETLYRRIVEGIAAAREEVGERFGWGQEGLS